MDVGILNENNIGDENIRELQMNQIVNENLKLNITSLMKLSVENDRKP